MRIFEESNPDWLYMKLHMFKRGLTSANQLTDDLIFDVRDKKLLSDIRLLNGNKFVLKKIRFKSII